MEAEARLRAAATEHTESAAAVPAVIAGALFTVGRTCVSRAYSEHVQLPNSSGHGIWSRRNGPCTVSWAAQGRPVEGRRTRFSGVVRLQPV
jgi:hypothetical protein